MIIQETYKIRKDNVKLIHTYSDAGFCIEKDGIIYGDAIDVEDNATGYVETTIPVDAEEEEE